VGPVIRREMTGPTVCLGHGPRAPELSPSGGRSGGRSGDSTGIRCEPVWHTTVDSPVIAREVVHTSGALAGPDLGLESAKPRMRSSTMALECATPRSRC
jgi:hypothetical protein